MQKLNFASDYTQGAHPAVLQALVDTNLVPCAGYGTDDYCEAARNLLREACGCKDAAVWFLSGGTQTNQTVLDALLRPWEGVIAADTGHVSCHEAGAIEFTGHKVISLPHKNGKLTAEAAAACAKSFYADDNHEHMVYPGAVYISQPTEYGTLYTLAELAALREVCDTYGMRLYADGARLAYALGSEENDVTLKDLARLCHAFYVGGTKCGALLGEAVVLPDPALCPRFFTQMKQHGALLAKGRVMGVQFGALFTNGLYETLGKNAVAAAKEMAELFETKGYRHYIQRQTNQVFLLLSDADYASLSKKLVMSFWEKPDEAHTAVRLAASWATGKAELDALKAALET